MKTTFKLAFVACLMMLILYGIQQNDALYFVLIVHSVQTLLVILLGIYGWIALAFTKKHNIQKQKEH